VVSWCYLLSSCFVLIAGRNPSEDHFGTESVSEDFLACLAELAKMSLCAVFVPASHAIQRYAVNQHGGLVREHGHPGSG
jgi:hypothetical protein